MPRARFMVRRAVAVSRNRLARETARCFESLEYSKARQAIRRRAFSIHCRRQVMALGPLALYLRAKPL